MCGICGWLKFNSSERIERHLLEEMTATLVHRGPDGGDVYVNNNIGIGHRRLSIIDLDAGKQPLSNEDETIWVSFNGEIYNYLELIPPLKQKGHRFKTKSDTEVLVHLYEEKGVQMLEDLRGMFAFAIWDDKNKRLFVARDRVGKKPLYYHHCPNEHLIFGSEIKSLLASKCIDRAVDLSALDQYLSFLYVPVPLSIFKEIKKLPAGHYMICEKGEASIHEYWKLRFTYGEKPVRSVSSYIEEFDEILHDAVRIRLRSDVPLGAFLSGGIDSSAIVSIMKDINCGQIQTLSIGFNEDEYNEQPYAKQIADLFGCHHSEFLVDADVSGIIEKLVGHFDEPFADPSFIPTYYVSKAARQKVTVALSGDGGDETLAGYSRHAIEIIEHQLRKYTNFLPSALLLATYNLLPEETKGRNIIGDLAFPPADAAARKHYNLLFNQNLKEKIYADPVDMHQDFSARFRAIYERSTANNPLDKALDLDINTYLTDDICVKVDRMSMAASLEVRAPLLDHKVLEFLASIPANMKLRDHTTKYILKKILEKKIPNNILTRKKQGFRLPIEVWLKNELREYTEEHIFSKSFKDRAIFNTVAVKDMWRSFLAGRRDYAHHIWQLLILEIWYRKYIDNQ